MLYEIMMHMVNSRMSLYLSCALRVLKMSTQLSESVYMRRRQAGGVRPEAHKTAEAIARASNRRSLGVAGQWEWRRRNLNTFLE